jgi:hypothetical protein
MLPKLLESPRVRRLIGLSLTVQGVLGVLAPRKLTKINARLWLREAFENPGDLDVTDAYAGVVRDASVAAIVLGLLTLRRASKDEAAAAEALDEEGDEEADPVEIDPEADED